MDTGNLRNSITHTADDDTAYIGTNVEYVPHVEFGTSTQIRCTSFGASFNRFHTGERTERFSHKRRAEDAYR